MQKQSKIAKIFFFFSYALVILEIIFLFFSLFSFIIAIRNASVESPVTPNTRYWLFLLLNIIVIMLFTVVFVSFVEKKFFNKLNDKQSEKKEYVNKKKAILCNYLILISTYAIVVIALIFVYLLALIPLESFYILFSLKSPFFIIYLIFLYFFLSTLIIGVRMFFKGACLIKKN